jgi:DNA-binding NtrC family response regulator
LAEGDTIGQSEFPQIATQVSGQPAEQPLVPDFSHAEMPLAALEIEPAAATAVAPAMPAADALPLLGADGEVRPLEELETELIRYAITHYRGQMSEVARRLRIGRSTLYRKLEALGLNTEQEELDSEGVAG